MQHGQVNKSIKVISLDRNCWVKVFNRFFVFIAMSFDLRDSLVLKKTTEESRYTCIYMWVCVLWIYSMFPASTLLWAYSSHLCVHITSPLSCLPSSSSAGRHTIALTIWFSPQCSLAQQMAPVLSPAVQPHLLLHQLFPDSLSIAVWLYILLCTVDQRVLHFLKYIFWFLLKNSLNSSLRTLKSTKLLVVEVIRWAFVYKAFLILNI